MKNDIKKYLTLFAVLIGSAFMVSCANPLSESVDLMMDKSKLKSSTATHDLYPSNAATPVINTTPLNNLLQDKLNKANQSISQFTNKEQAEIAVANESIDSKKLK